MLLKPSLSSAAGIGPDEAEFTSAVKSVNPGLVRAAAA
jgi:hypothetical protein